MMGVCSHMRADLEEAAPDCFRFTADRDYYDYIYLRTDLATLKGKRYQPKRNHINKFLRTYPDYQYLPLDATLVPECLELADRWCRLNETTEEERRELEDEHRSLTDALNHFDELRVAGRRAPCRRTHRGVHLRRTHQRQHVRCLCRRRTSTSKVRTP